MLGPAQRSIAKNATIPDGLLATQHRSQPYKAGFAILSDVNHPPILLGMPAEGTSMHLANLSLAFPFSLNHLLEDQRAPICNIHAERITL
jgi:hypothetical protein